MSITVVLLLFKLEKKKLNEEVSMDYPEGF